MKTAKKKKNAKETKGQKTRSNTLKNAITKLAGTPAPAPKVKENTLWNWFKDGVIKALSDWRGENRLKQLHMIRVENETGPIVDVEGVYNGTGFTAELKTLARPELKKKKDAPVLTLPHFTTAQALFLAARWDAGERSWLFVQIGDTRYLIPGNIAYKFQKSFKESEMKKVAVETLFGDTPMDYLLAMVGR